MKKLFAGFLVLTVICSCNNSGTTSNESNKPAEADVPATKAPEKPTNSKGFDLIVNSDCATCHQIEAKTTGPSYREVANKYENNDASVKLLTEKIIKGGQGNWGEIPMIAHPQISEADATEMVKYILSLKSK